MQKNSLNSSVSFRPLRIVCALLLGLLAPSARSQEVSDDTSAAPFWYFDAHPIQTVSLRTYYMASRYPAQSYTLINSDGDELVRGWTPFFSIEGGGRFTPYLDVDYKFQGSGTNPVVLKRAHVRYKDSYVSIELARGSVWMGHGYHGSLLLSNHAEPFTLIKFQTERPLSIPYIGDFNYMLFHGWPQSFKIIGHRLSYHPFSWLELGGNQTVTYKLPRKLWEIPKMLIAKEANLGDLAADDEFRASIDVAVHLPFVRDFLPPLRDLKLYLEYAGEDIAAFWQPEDRGLEWIWPFGFEFIDIGTTFGIWLATEKNELRVEYSSNFRNNGWFKDFYGFKHYAVRWYRNRYAFTNQGNIMGHHMGPEADDFYIEFLHRWDNASLRFFYDKERHGLIDYNYWPWRENASAEKLSQYGVEYTRKFEKFTLGGLFLWNRYENLDMDPDPLWFNIHPRKAANLVIVGLTISYTFE